MNGAEKAYNDNLWQPVLQACGRTCGPKVVRRRHLIKAATVARQVWQEF